MTTPNNKAIGEGSDYLYAHAREIVDEDKKKVGLFLGTGSTKTRIALSLSRGKTLVICPKTQKEDRNWEREVLEIQKVFPEFTIDLTVLSKEKFKAMCVGGWRKRFDTVIVDEAHKCLGTDPDVRYVKKQAIPKTSHIHEWLATYIRETNPDRFYLATATVDRSPMTVWAAARLLGYDWNFYDFRQAFYFPISMNGHQRWLIKKDDETKNRLAKAVQKIGYTGRIFDYFDVPDQTYKTITLELTEAQKQRLKTIKLEYPDPLVLLGKSHQIENGVLTGDQYNKAETFPNQKIDTILDLALEFPKMVIFARYRAQIDLIQNELSNAGYTVWTLTGDTKDRRSVIHDSNAASSGILIAQSQISEGWEAPTFPVMVFASLDYSVVNRIQAEGRVLRANALKKNLYIDLVVKGGVDEAVHKAIGEKKDFNERIYLKLN